MSETAYSDPAEKAGPTQQGASDQLSMELGRFGELLDQLEAALKPALRPESPKTVPADTPITSELRHGVYRFGELNMRLMGLIERVDV